MDMYMKYVHNCPSYPHIYLTNPAVMRERGCSIAKPPDQMPAAEMRQMIFHQAPGHMGVNENEQISRLSKLVSGSTCKDRSICFTHLIVIDFIDDDENMNHPSHIKEIGI